MKPAGALLSVAGGILVLIGFIWGWVVGFYPNELPVIVVLLLIGAGALWLGSKLYASAPDTPAVKRAVSPTPSTHWLAASAPAVEPVRAVESVEDVEAVQTVEPVRVVEAVPAPDDEISPSTSAGELAGLAANPSLWSQIELHPNAYPALIEWINEQRSSQRPREADAARPPSDPARQASDPATPPSELAELAQQHPELRAAIATNPAAYPELREWIAQNGAE